LYHDKQLVSKKSIFMFISIINTELEWFFNLASLISEGEQRQNYLQRLRNLTGNLELFKISKLSFIMH